MSAATVPCRISVQKEVMWKEVKEQKGYRFFFSSLGVPELGGLNSGTVKILLCTKSVHAPYSFVSTHIQPGFYTALSLHSYHCLPHADTQAGTFLLLQFQTKPGERVVVVGNQECMVGVLR